LGVILTGIATKRSKKKAEMGRLKKKKRVFPYWGGLCYAEICPGQRGKFSDESKSAKTIMGPKKPKPERCEQNKNLKTKHLCSRAAFPL